MVCNLLDFGIYHSCQLFRELLFYTANFIKFFLDYKLQVYIIQISINFICIVFITEINTYTFYGNHKAILKKNEGGAHHKSMLHLCAYSKILSLPQDTSLASLGNHLIY